MAVGKHSFRTGKSISVAAWTPPPAAANFHSRAKVSDGQTLLLGHQKFNDHRRSSTLYSWTAFCRMMPA